MQFYVGCFPCFEFELFQINKFLSQMEKYINIILINIPIIKKKIELFKI